MTEPDPLRVLVDTQALIWAAQDPGRLSPTALAVLRPRENDLLLSAATVWEMAIKVRLGKLELRMELEDFIDQQTSALILTHLDVTYIHGLRTRLLPLHHKDPFDRLLVAQALVEGVPIVSSDTFLAQYGVEVIW